MKNVPLDLSDVHRLYLFYCNLTPLVTKFYKPFKEISEDVMRSHLEGAVSGKHISFGLKNDEEIVGHSFVMQVRSEHPVFGIGLAEHFHGKGLGRRLMQVVLAEAEFRGAGHVTLTVLKNNHRALALYRSFGFIVVTDHTFKVKNDSYFMERFRDNRVIPNTPR